MGPTEITFVGGKSDGLVLHAGEGYEPPANMAINGEIYAVYRISDGVYVAKLPTAPPPDNHNPKPNEPVNITDGGVLNAWHQLARAVNSDSPKAVLATRDVRNRIRAAGRRGR